MRAILPVVLLMVACTPREAPPAEAMRPATTDSATAWALDATGFGPVKTGISLAQLNRELGEHLTPAYQVSTTCDHVDPASFPDGVIVMIEHDSVARFDVESPAVRTREGAGVGDLEADVVKLYGSIIAVTPHKYTGPEGHYLTVTQPGDSLHLIIFETDGRTVLSMRAGRRPAVEYVEGCA